MGGHGIGHVQEHVEMHVIGYVIVIVEGYVILRVVLITNLLLYLHFTECWLTHL